MTKQDLIEVLQKQDIKAFEYENIEGDTIGVIYFKDVSIADIEDYGNGLTLRLQKEI